MLEKFLFGFAIAFSLLAVSCNALISDKLVNPDHSQNSGHTAPVTGGIILDKTIKDEKTGKIAQLVKELGFPEGTVVETVNHGFDLTWEKTFQSLLAYPLVSVDKSSGVIITDWIIDQKALANNADMLGMGSAQIERNKYVIKLVERNSKSEIAVVQVAQRSKAGHWVGKPANAAFSNILMNAILSNMEK